MKRLILAVDGSPASIMASHWAVSFASLTDVDITIVHATEPAGSPENTGAAALGDLTSPEIPSTFEQAGVSYNVRLPEGEAATEILEVAADLNADIIVLGRRSHALLHPRLLGKLTRKVLQGAAAPVAIVPGPEEHPSPEEMTPTIVVGLDRSVESKSILGWAVKLGKILDFDLEVLTVLNLNAETAVGTGRAAHKHFDRSETPALSEMVAELDPDHLTRIAAHTQFGIPIDELLRRSTRAELLVLGTRHQSTADRLLYQSTSHYCAAHARCPVVLVPLDTGNQ